MDREIEYQLKAIQHQLAEETERLRPGYKAHMRTQGSALCGAIGRQERNPDSIENHQDQLISNMNDLCDILSRSLDKIGGSRPCDPNCAKEPSPCIVTRFHRLHAQVSRALADARLIQEAL